MGVILIYEQLLCPAGLADRFAWEETISPTIRAAVGPHHARRPADRWEWMTGRFTDDARSLTGSSPASACAPHKELDRGCRGLCVPLLSGGAPSVSGALFLAKAGLTWSEFGLDRLGLGCLTCAGDRC